MEDYVELTVLDEGKEDKVTEKNQDLNNTSSANEDVGKKQASHEERTPSESKTDRETDRETASRKSMGNAGTSRGSVSKYKRRTTIGTSKYDVHGDLELPGEAEPKIAAENQDGPFQFNHKGLSSAEAAERLLKYGPNELPDRSTPKWKIFCSLLIQPMALMMWLGAIVEGAIENFADMGILFGIIFANAGLGYYETTKAGDAVAALKASLRPSATVKRDGEWKNMDASQIVPGDLILLAQGSAIPADARLNSGEIEVDQAALTGESIPVKMKAGDLVNHPKMGSTVMKGEVEGTVEFTGANTMMGQTASLLEGPPRPSNLQKVLLRITFVLVVASLTLSAVVFIFGLALGEPFKEALSFTVVLVVASIPLAIEIVCTTTLALGSKELAKQGAIVTRLTAIEDLAGMDMLCSDKTGTLTTNKMEIQDETPLFLVGETRSSCLQYAAMAAKWLEPARDALDTLVLSTANLSALKDVEQPEYIPFDPVTKRTESTVKLPTGEKFKVSKGAPHVIIALCEATEQEKANMLEHQHKLAARGVRCLAVARTIEDKWKMVGMLTFLDPPREDSLRTIQEAAEFGVPVKMITGDHLLIAKETARLLKLKGSIFGPNDLPMMEEDGGMPKDLAQKYGKVIEPAGGFAQVFPQHKYLIVACLRELSYKVGMTGDGVNDAPALKQADVGIAVSGATDAACAAADIILTEPGLHTIINGIVLARQIFQRLHNFICYRIAASLQLLLFFFIAVLSLQPHHYNPEWPQFFKMPVLLLMLITLLNDGTLISIGYDRVKPSASPSIWNLRELFAVAAVMGLIACLSSLLLLWGALDSGNPNGLFAAFGITPLHYGQVTAMVYLKVSVSDFLTLFSSRGGSGPFWSSAPAPILIGAAGLALTLSTVLACAWPSGELDRIRIEGLGYSDPKLLALWVWLYSIFVWFIQDACKVGTYKLLKRYNLTGSRRRAHILTRRASVGGQFASEDDFKPGNASIALHTHKH